MLTVMLRFLNHQELGARLQLGQHLSNLPVLALDRKLHPEPNKPGPPIFIRGVREAVWQQPSIPGRGPDRAQYVCQTIVQIAEHVREED